MIAHIQGLIGTFLILAFGLYIGLSELYKYAFVPQTSIVRVIGAIGEQCYESVETEGLCFKQKTRQICQIEAYIISNDSVFFGWVVRDWNF